MKTKKITTAQIDILKKSIEKMAKSSEQFFFMIFKNENGTDNITQYSWNMVPEKMKHYWEKALETAELEKEI